MFVFPSQTDGKELEFSHVKKVVADLGEKAGVRTVRNKTATAHDFRRSFGSRWAMKVMPQVLQKLMRHSDIVTTITFYAHLDSDMIIEAIMSDDQNVKSESATEKANSE